MKRILQMSSLTIALVAAVCVVCIAPAFQRTAYAGLILNFRNNGYYYGPGYGSYPVYGQGPYVYGGNGGASYPAYGAGPYGYDAPVVYGQGQYGNYRSSYYGPSGIMTYNGPYGYRGFDGYRR